MAFLVIIVVVCTVVLMTAQQKKPAKNQQGPTRQPQPTVNETNEYISRQEAKNSGDSPKGWHKFVTWPESWTAWALIVTLGVVALQASLMREHAEHLRTLGEHMVGSERAWFTCSIGILWNNHEKIGHSIGHVRFSYLNNGRTPGFVTEIGFAMDVLDETVFLPETPSGYESKDHQRWNGRGFPIGPRDSFGRRGRLEIDKRQEGDLNAGRRVLWVHGFVRYRDAFQETEHETRYCLRWNPKYKDTGEIEFSIDGPEAYNSAT